MLNARTLVLAAAAALVALPLTAAAIGIPIGGKVIAQAPCPKSPAYVYTVAGFGVGAGVFSYVFGTPTFLWGPPVLGRWVLGFAAPFGPCFAPATTPITGTSPAI